MTIIITADDGTETPVTVDPALYDVLAEVVNVLGIVENRIAPALIDQQTGEDGLHARMTAALSRIMEATDAG